PSLESRTNQELCGLSRRISSLPANAFPPQTRAPGYSAVAWRSPGRLADLGADGSVRAPLPAACKATRAPPETRRPARTPVVRRFLRTRASVESAALRQVRAQVRTPGQERLPSKGLWRTPCAESLSGTPGEGRDSLSWRSPRAPCSAPSRGLSR